MLNGQDHVVEPLFTAVPPALGHEAHRSSAHPAWEAKSSHMTPRIAAYLAIVTTSCLGAFHALKSIQDRSSHLTERNQP